MVLKFAFGCVCVCACVCVTAFFFSISNHRRVLGKQTGLLAPSYKIVAKSDRYDIKILYNTYFIVIE